MLECQTICNFYYEPLFFLSDNETYVKVSKDHVSERAKVIKSKYVYRQISPSFTSDFYLLEEQKTPVKEGEILDSGDFRDPEQEPESKEEEDC